MHRATNLLIFTWSFILLSFFFILLPLPINLNWYRPEILVLSICFLSLNFPYSFGVWSAWWVGLATDIFLGTLLGSHAFIFAFIAYFCGKMSFSFKRMLFIPQTLFIAFMVFLKLLFMWVIVDISGNRILDIKYLLTLITSVPTWFLLNYILNIILRRLRLYKVILQTT